jgi:GNAT superfamily N-acetyltransferase
LNLRSYQTVDAQRIDELAVTAFSQFKDAYTDWPLFRTKISNMSALSETGEIIVAELAGDIVGAVAYIGPGKEKAAFFRPEWPVMRMLVVAPAARGHGVGRALAEECLARARRDGASSFALHTSELMRVALPMYQRMGFTWLADAPDIHGVKYGIYLKELHKADA